MSFTNIFLWVVFPYICLTIFVVGHIYRYNTDQFGWTAKSSQLLERKQLKWGSILFHYGIIIVFFGHVAGILVPKGFYDLIGITDDLYHFGSVWFGGAAGVATLIGGLLLTVRRFTVKRIFVTSAKRDLFSLLLLGFVVIAGFSNTVGYTATGGHFDYREFLGPWFRGILTFQPMPELMAVAPFGFKLHVFLAFVLFAIWPFTRLVHVWSVPLTYLNRRYVVYRKMTPPKVLNRK